MEYTCPKCKATHNNVTEQEQNGVIWKVYACPECGAVRSEWDRTVETNTNN